MEEGGKEGGNQFEKGTNFKLEHHCAKLQSYVKITDH